jgi:hypothetical protein
MALSPRVLIYLAILVGILMLFQRLKRLFLLFSLAVLPGTFCHELCHLCVGGLLGGQPAAFTILPRWEGHAYVMGSVAFARVRWYNAFFLGLAPLLLLPAAYGLLAWRLKGHPGFSWGEGLWLYLIANLVYAALPSWQDFRIAARSPIGWLLLAAAALYGWFRVAEPTTQPKARLDQLQEPRLSCPHAPLRNPGTDLRLSQAHQIG